MLGCGRGTMMHTLTLPSQARLLITVVLSGVTGWPRRRLVLCRHTPCMSRNTDGIEAANVLGHCIYVVVVSSRVLAEINLLLPLCEAPWICLLLDYSRCRQCTVSPAEHKGHATHSHTHLCVSWAPRQHDPGEISSTHADLRCCGVCCCCCCRHHCRNPQRRGHCPAARACGDHLHAERWTAGAHLPGKESNATAAGFYAA